MPFKSDKQRGFLEEKFHKNGNMGPSAPKSPSVPNPKMSFAKDIQMPSMNGPEKFGRLKNLMKKSY